MPLGHCIWYQSQSTLGDSMAENTRMKAIDDACKKNEKQLEQLNEHTTHRFNQQELLINELRKETAELRRDLDVKFDKMFAHMNLDKQKGVNNEESSNTTSLSPQSGFIYLCIR